MRISRRKFLAQTGLTASSLLLAGRARASMAGMAAQPPPESLFDPGTLTPFADPLPLPPLARAAGMRPSPENPAKNIPFYRMVMSEFRAKVHRDLPPTRLWGFNGVSPGPLFDTRGGESLLVEWANNLPEKHFLPIDYRLHGAEKNLPEVRSVIHLHGGRTPAESDGYPEDWYVPGKRATYFYPNRQDAATLFYHDHTMGINRLNVYAGLLGMYLIRDAQEDTLALPRGRYEIPLTLADRYLRRDGQLLYPVSGIPGAPWVPEVFGNAVLANGKLLPYHEVEPRPYRLRVLNGSNGRFYRLSLEGAAGSDSAFQMIGSDQGLLAAPVELNRVLLAPAERADLIVDFAPHAGRRLTLVSDSLTILEFRVAKTSTEKSRASLPAVLRDIPKPDVPAAARTRRLTLDEHLNLADQSIAMLLNNTPWDAPVTEKPTLGDTEIWELLNLTEDSHPIHLHLVRFQILDRRPFDSAEYLTSRTVRYSGDAAPPAPEEAGWKDTVRADPGTITRILVKFEGYTGRYVWHCHLLEHEDNEMMRPYEVLPARLAAG